MKRKLALFGSAMLMICSIGEVAAQQKELKRIRLNVFRVDAATVAARVHSYFAAEGLDVEITVTPNSTDQMRGVSQGKFEIASTAFDNVLAWSGRLSAEAQAGEGAEIVAVAQISDKTVLPVFVRPEIKTWSDLKGKKLAADAVDTAFALVLRRILLANGLDMTRGDYELVALGTTALRLESMIKGETFAGILNTPFDAKALDAGMRRIGDSREVLPDYPNTILAVNREWGQKNRDTLVSYLRAWLKGMSWVKDPANREAAIKLVGAELKLNPKQAAESVDELSHTGNLNLPGLQVVLDLRNQFGFKLAKGDKLPVYYDAVYFNAARGK
jgi:ABC-type nitrate/sulfonate/bicarbonate transport system substrate-binding protein